MENKTELHLDIGADDIQFIKSHLKGLSDPIEFEALLFQVARYKTRDKRQSQVKIYDPGCEYRVGDLIYKEYSGRLPVGGKNTIELTQGVILSVEEARSRMGLNEIRLSYDGTSEFRRYTEYLKRQKIELLLPHKQEDPPLPDRYLAEPEDPRAQQAPLIERDLNILRKKLVAALHRESDIAYISDRVILKENLKPIKAEIFDSIKEFLKSHQASESTEFFIKNFLNLEPDAPEFAAYCFALNYTMTHQYKIDFQQTISVGWGKWHLISTLYYLKKNALISEINPLLSSATLQNKKNLAQRRKKLEEAIFAEGENRYYLTQREIASGALKLKAGLYDFGNATEIEALDAGNQKSHLLYYYPEANLLLGLGQMYESYKAVQGTIISFEQRPDKRFLVTVKTSKKGTITDKIVYDPEKKTFRLSEEKISTPVFVNKAIFLEPEALKTLEATLAELRKIETFNKLIHKIFLTFGVKERNYELHLLRLYHILDMIYAVDMRLVADVILSNAEFIPSEKVIGVFYLDSDAVVEIEEEERIRRLELIEEGKRRREEMRKSQLEEELKKKDDIRQLREERKRKREDEMRLKEKHEQERLEHKRLETPPALEEEALRRPRPDRKIYARKEEAGGKPAFRKAGAEAEMPVKTEPTRKMKKKVETEKPIKTAKKGQKKILEEKIELEEIKKQILSDEELLKAAEEEEIKKEPVKEVKVAYQDKGGFAGILGSKLDEVVKKEKKGKEKK